MIEQKISISKSVFSTLKSHKDGFIDQVALNKNLLSDICNLLKLQKEKDFNDSIFIPNKNLATSFFEKIEEEMQKSVFEGDNFSIIDDNRSIPMSTISRLSYKFQELRSKENENDLNGKYPVNAMNESVFDNISVFDKNEFASIKRSDNLTSNYRSSLSKDSQALFFKRCKPYCKF